MPKLRQLKANNNAIIGKSALAFCSRISRPCHLCECTPNPPAGIEQFVNNTEFFRIVRTLFALADVETEEIITSDSLEMVDLRRNPLTPQCLDRLKHAKVHFHIELPERIKEEWEDFDD